MFFTKMKYSGFQYFVIYIQKYYFRTLKQHTKIIFNFCYNMLLSDIILSNDLQLK